MIVENRPCAVFFLLADALNLQPGQYRPAVSLPVHIITPLKNYGKDF